MPGASQANACPCVEMTDAEVAAMHCKTHRLRPGEALFLPRGVVHQVTPVGHHRAVHATIGFHRATWKFVAEETIKDAEMDEFERTRLLTELSAISKLPAEGADFRESFPLSTVMCAHCDMHNSSVTEEADCFRPSCAQQTTQDALRQHLASLLLRLGVAGAESDLLLAVMDELAIPFAQQGRTRTLPFALRGGLRPSRSLQEVVPGRGQVKVGGCVYQCTASCGE